MNSAQCTVGMTALHHEQRAVHCGHDSLLLLLNEMNDANIFVLFLDGGRNTARSSSSRGSGLRTSRGAMEAMSMDTARRRKGSGE